MESAKSAYGVGEVSLRRRALFPGRYPSGGSQLGGVPVRVYGEHLSPTAFTTAAEAAPACTFGGAVTVAASFAGAGLDELLCMAPPLPESGGAVIVSPTALSTLCE